MKIPSILIILVVAGTTAGQVTPDDSTLADKLDYQGSVFMGTGGNFTNLGASIRMKPPALLKEYDVEPFLSIAYIYGDKIYNNEEYYFEGVTVALELHRQINTGIKAFDLVTFAGAGLPIPGGAPDADEEKPEGLNYFLTGGLKVQRSMIELDARAGLLRSWPLPKPTPFLTMNVGVRANSLIHMPAMFGLGFAILAVLTVIPMLVMAN